MASQSLDARTLDPDRITFDVERLSRQDGLLLVSGRWYGVRGRRFVRPTLIVGADGSEQQVLADLEHKPWAAQDGTLWQAAFPTEADPAKAERIELAVAPDITVVIAPSEPGAAAPSAARAGAGGKRRSAAADSPRAQPRGGRAHRPPGRSAGDLAYENDRLKARLAAAEQAHQRERTRRETSDGALEEERAEALRLRSELGRAKAELDLAQTAERELSATLAELEAARTEARQSGQRLQSARAEAQDTGQRLRSARSQSDDVARQLRDARAAAQQAERTLSGAQRALTEQRVENKRLRDQLTRHAAAQPGSGQSGQGLGQPGPGSGQPGSGSGSGQAGPASGAAPAVPTPEPSRAAAPSQVPASVASGRSEPAVRAEQPHASDLGHRHERPVNPALAGINPTARMIAVCVVVAVLVAVVLVIRTTV